MMSAIWPWVLISMVAMFLVGFPAWGLYKWTPRRAQLLRRLEIFEDRDAVIAHIAYIRVRHPEIVRLERLDRHPAYVWMNVLLLIYGLVTFFGAAPYAAFGGEALDTRATLAGSLLLGSSAALIGTLMGKQLGPIWIRRSVIDNDTSAMLGDDVRVPYVLAWVGLASTTISMAFYGYTVIATVGTLRLLTTLGGIAAIGFTAICLTLIPSFIHRIRTYVTARDTVLTEAFAIMDEQDG